MALERDLIVAALVAGGLLSTGCGDDSTAEERPCDVSGHACTWAGIPDVLAFTPDGASRLDTALYWPMDLSFAADGTAWFIDWNNHLVRRVLADDTVKSYVGWVDPVFPGDGLPGMAERTAEGAPGLEVQLNHPTDLVQLPDGKVLIMAWHNHKLRQLDPVTGRVRIVAGGGAGFAGDGGTALGTMTLFRQPKALERAANGDLYILDQQNFRVRKIDAVSGMVTTVAGNGMQGSDGDGGPALMAKLGFEAGSNPEPSGGLALAGGKLFISDTLGNKVRAVDLTSGVIDVVAGTGTEGHAGDGGPALAAQLAHPRDLELGPDGELYIADTDSNSIRAVNLTSGMIRTVAGTGVLGLDEDDGRLATETRLRRPFGIEFDRSGALYIADTINSRILKVAR